MEVQKKKFDKKKYNAEYDKLHKRKFAAALKIDEYAEIDEFLKRHNINKAQFVRLSYQRLKEELESE